MKVRRLNGDGLEKFGRFLDSLTTDAPDTWPEFLLTEVGSTDPIGDLEVEHRTFASRLEAAAYLHEQLARAEGVSIERDTGLWAWLSLFYFDQLCAKGSRGEYKPGARAKWIPESGDFRRYYRHLLAGPYLIYRAHRDDPKRALALLCGPVEKPGEIVEQLASRQELVTSAAVVETATRLYVDESTALTKAGAAGKGRGSARRLAEILNQFDLTWDFAVMDSDEILNMLPREFDKFLTKN